MSTTNKSPLQTPSAEGCAHGEWRTQVNERLDAGAVKMGQLHRDLQDNTQATRQVQADTQELIEFFRSVKGAFRVLEWLGKMARPLGYIATAGAALVGLWKVVKGGGG